VNDVAASGREHLERLGPALVPAREIRYIRDEFFADVTDDELGKAAASLRALSHSCREGARKLERILRDREATG
jgi:hypothetical protein